MVSESSPSIGGVILPRPTRLVLRNFSLYRRRRTVEVDFEREVFCLAGANGLGKSTFLAALSYAMTGVVARPGHNFLRVSDYYHDLIEYSTRYFDGRINAEDHEIAEVELSVSVGALHITLVRGMFEPQGLRQLRLDGPGAGEDLAGPEITEAERHRRYVDVMCEATRLSDFAQLVFLQLVVLTFDEQRRLMFWTPRATEQALFLAFGLSADVASRAEALQRTYDSAESRARNLQWQATGRRRRLLALQEATGPADANVEDADIRDEHVRLSSVLDHAGDEMSEAEAAYAEADAALDDLAAKLLEARSLYDSAYSERVVAAHSAPNHPVVMQALDGKCVICSAGGPSVSAAVREALDARSCPFCGSPLEDYDPVEADKRREHLRELSDRIVHLEEAEQAARAQIDRRRKALDTLDRRVRDTSKALEEFRKANSQALLRASGEAGMIEEATRGLQEEINDLLTQKDAELSRRDAAHTALDELRDELTARFAEMEHEFVPLLHDLANEFLGVRLEVDLQRRGAQLGLVLSLAGSERRSPEALSESQRFFVDIALRMALASKLASPGQPATLYVDTPEGSLDIAYEMRAGRMFGRFAQGNGGNPNRLIMTANINTSQLLQQLAAVCGRDSMDLVRMTDWTELSDVQLEAEADFEAAYTVIERRLDGRDG